LAAEAKGESRSFQQPMYLFRVQRRFETADIEDQEPYFVVAPDRSEAARFVLMETKWRDGEKSTYQDDWMITRDQDVDGIVAPR